MTVDTSHGDLAAVAEQLMAEGLVSLAEIAEKLPTRNGKRRTAYTVKCWAIHGRRKGQIKLEAIETASGWWSSWPAIARFFGNLTATTLAEKAPLPATLDRDLQRRDRAARAELKRRYGIACDDS